MNHQFAITRFENTVTRLMQERGLSRAQAIRDVAVHNPQVHAAYLDAYNAMHGQHHGRRGRRTV